MRDTASVWLFTTRTIMSARCLDRFPAGKGPQQVAHQGGLANLRCESADCYDCWTLHRVSSSSNQPKQLSKRLKRNPRHSSIVPLLFPFRFFRRRVWGIDLQISSRVPVETVLNILDLTAFILLANRERLILPRSFHS